MGHRRGPLRVIRVGSMVPVRPVTPVRGVVHGQIGSPVGVPHLVTLRNRLPQVGSHLPINACDAAPLSSTGSSTPLHRAYLVLQWGKGAYRDVSTVDRGEMWGTVERSGG
jgi:hypothetical protein